MVFIRTKLYIVLKRERFGSFIRIKQNIFLER